MSRLAIRVIPKAGTDQVAGLRCEELVIRVRAAPEADKANQAACKAVAGFLGVPPRDVEVVHGRTSRHKVLEVSGVSEEELSRKLAETERLG